jgi:hypothetical protein
LTLSLILRIVRVGAAAALVVGLAGWALERSRFGVSDEAALRRVEDELRERFDTSAETLGAMAARVAAEPELLRGAPRDPAAVRRLFDAVSAAMPAEAGTTGITIDDVAGEPLAWAGRVSDLPKERVLGPATLLICPGALGPRLVRIEPVSRSGTRPRTIVVEQALGTCRGRPGLSDTFVLPLRWSASRCAPRREPRTPPPVPFTFVVRAPQRRVRARSGGLACRPRRGARALAARDRGRGARRRRADLCCSAPGRSSTCARQVRDMSRFVALTALLIVLVVVVRGILYLALVPLAQTPAPTPADLFLTTLTLAAVVWLVLDLTERRRAGAAAPAAVDADHGRPDGGGGRVRRRGPRRRWLLWAYERLLRRVVADTDLDLLHFSLHPLSGARVAVEFSLVLLHAAVIWGAAPSCACRPRCGARRGHRSGAPARPAAGSRARSSPRSSHALPGRRFRWAALGCAVVRRGGGDGAGTHQPAPPPRVAERTPGDLLPGAADAGDCDVPVASRARDRGEGAARRDGVRTAGGQPA